MTSFLSRPSGPPLELDPRHPERGYLSVVQSFFKNNNLPLEFDCKAVGPQHDPLWEVFPIIMGEAHECFKVSHMKKQYAMNACAHFIAISGHC
ncbi:hypothetical protein BDV93DRAFT_606360 [Ceratobasidium sp. AG-I]|nr:hypothetical protein BDV93DRAFT_606360 [Ceratobasidium sp. AG-I]